MKRNFITTLLILALLFFCKDMSFAQSQSYYLKLKSAYPSGKGDLPLLLYFNYDNGVTDITTTVPFVDRSLENFNANGSSVTVNSGNITGSFTSSVLGKNFSIDLNASVDNNIVTGTFNGTVDGSSISGKILGSKQKPMPSGNDYKVSCFIKTPYPSDFSQGWNVSDIMAHAFFDIKDGTLNNFSIKNGRAKGSVYRSLGIIRFEAINYINPFGRNSIYPTILREDNEKIVPQNSTFSISGNTMTAEMNVTYDGNDYTYKLTGDIFGNTILGNVNVSQNGSTVASNLHMAGHIGEGKKEDINPGLSSLKRADEITGNTFQPSYFEELTENNLKNRLDAGINFLKTTPTIGIFDSPYILAGTRFTQNKQYDNGPINGYGGAALNHLLYQISDSDSMKHRAKMAAENAGYALISRKKGVGVQEFYKKMFFYSPFAGVAYLHNYQLTNDDYWLEEAKDFAQTIESLQKSDGSWPMANESGGTENESKHPAEYLWFLGKLRKDGGVKNFESVESDAYQYLQNNGTDMGIWTSRLSKNGEGHQESFGPTLYLKYMLKYAKSVNKSHFEDILSLVENNFINWQHTGPDKIEFLPNVKSRWPRHQSWEPYGLANRPSSAASARMAYVYAMASKRYDNEEYLKKAKALAHSVLSQQTDFGFIHHLENRDWSMSHFKRIVKQGDSHQMSGLKADLLVNLYNYYELLKKENKTCTKSQEINFLNPGTVLASSDSIELQATTSHSLPVSFSLISGPGTLDGDVIHLNGNEGILEVVANQEGQDDVCAAPAVVHHISVGNTVPDAPEDLKVKPFAVSQLKLNWTDKSNNEQGFLIQRKEFGEDWVIADSVYNATEYLDTGLKKGKVYTYRVASFNGIGWSMWSNEATSKTPSTEVQLYYETECGKIGTGWEIRDETGISNDQKIYAVEEYTESRPEDGDPSVAKYEITIPRAGQYQFWWRSKTDGGGAADSFWRKVSQEGNETSDPKFYAGSIGNTSEWQWWTMYKSPKHNNVHIYDLEAGKVTIQFGARETDAEIDKFYLTTKVEKPSEIGETGLNCSEITKKDQSIDFPAISDKTEADPDFELNATTNSELEVQYRVISGPAEVSGNVVSLTGPGDVTIEAFQPGDPFHHPADPVQRSFNVEEVIKQEQTINPPSIDDTIPVNTPPIELNASATSGLELFYRIVSGPATLDGNVISLTGITGEVTVEVTQPGNVSYHPADTLTFSFYASEASDKKSQSISVSPVSDKLTTDDPFNIDASASSGLPVSYNLISGPASLNGNEVTLSGDTGTVVIEITQEGNSEYLAAKPLTVEFKVSEPNSGKKSQSISVSPVSDKLTTDDPFNIDASASSGLPVSYNLISGPASLNGNEVTLSGDTGTVVIEITQEGNSEYFAADPLTVEFEVSEPSSKPELTTFTSSGKTFCLNSTMMAQLSASGNFNSGNKIIIEITGASNDFSSATELKTFNTMPSSSFELSLPSNAGTYKIRARSTDPESFSDIITDIEMVDNLEASIMEGSELKICPGKDTLIHAVPANTNYTYQWYKNSDPVEGNGSSLSINKEGTYSVKISNKNVCEDSSDTGLQLSFYPGIDVSINPSGNQDLCKGDTLKLNSEISGENYVWFRNGKPLQGENHISYSLTEQGSYNVKVITKNGCSDTANQPVSVNYLNTGTVTIEPSGNVKSCKEQVLTASGSDNYQWYKNGNPVSGANQDTFTVQSEGIYTVKAGSDKCRIEPDVQANVDIVKQTPVTPGNITGKDSVCIKDEATYEVSSNNENLSYSWDPPHGSYIKSGQNTPQVTIKFENFRQEKDSLLVYSKNACGESKQPGSKVLYQKCPVIDPPNAFTPDQSGKNTAWHIPGLSNYESPEVKVFNRWGTLVFKSVGYDQPWRGLRNGKELPAGTYYYIIETGIEGENFTGTITILR